MHRAVASDREVPLVGAFRRLLSRRGFGDAAARHDIERTAARAHDQRAPRRNRQWSRLGERCAFLVCGRQDDRRLTGIERRGDPGIDPDIGRRQHAVPIERRNDAHRPFVARGEIGRHQHHQDQRTQRPGVVDRKPRRRQAGANALDRGQRAFALFPPQRLRKRVLRRQGIGERGCRAMADAGAAVEAAKRIGAGGPAEANQRPQHGNGGGGEQDEPGGARQRRQRQPEAGPGNGEEQSGKGQKPRQMRPDALPRDRI